jgi:hypothetical protein
MAGVDIARVIGQQPQIQAFRLRQPSAAVQRDGLLVQGFSIHISRIRRHGIPSTNSKSNGVEHVNRRQVMALMGAAA